MDTTVNKINNNFHLWSEQRKRESVRNRIKKPGIAKVIIDADTGKRRVIYSFYTGIRDGVSLLGHDTGTFLISSRHERH